jgi:hypothetical protein
VNSSCANPRSFAETARTPDRLGLKAHLQCP